MEKDDRTLDGDGGCEGISDCMSTSTLQSEAMAGCTNNMFCHSIPQHTRDARRYGVLTFVCERRFQYPKNSALIFTAV